MGKDSRPKPNPERERSRRSTRQAAKKDCYIAQPERSLVQIVHAAAFHEAGHVVSAFALGFDVRYSILNITVDPRGVRIGGFTKAFLGAAKDCSDADKRRLREKAFSPDVLRIRALQVLAGPIAEARVNCDDSDIFAGAEGDHRTVLAFAMLALQGTGKPKHIPHRQVIEWFNARQQESNHLVASIPSEVIREIANALIARATERVTGTDLRRIFDKKKGGT